MNSELLKPRFIFIVATIIAGAAFRFIPHWPNFTPVAAIALFGGTYLNRKSLAFVIPLAAMLLSDLLLGLHQSMWAVYLSFGITVMIGFAIRGNIRTTNVIMASLASSVIFFLLTNFAAWMISDIYSKDFAGLMACYIAGLAFLNNGSYGISFFMNEVIGTLVFNGIFFGGFYLAQKRFPVLARVA